DLRCRERDQRRAGRAEAVAPEFGGQASWPATEYANARELAANQFSRAVARGIDHDDLAPVVDLVEEPADAGGHRGARLDRRDHDRHVEVSIGAAVHRLATSPIAVARLCGPA